MSDWINLDEQWQQRSKHMFQRCINEPDMSKAQLAWYAACQSEEMRLEWKYGCLEQERFGAFVIAAGDRSFFTPESSPYVS